MKKGIFTKILYLVAILLLATQDIFADVSNPPQTIPVPPTQEAASVKSIFIPQDILHKYNIIIYISMR